jgi:hypothetical protein
MFVVMLNSGDFSGVLGIMASPRWLVYISYID